MDIYDREIERLTLLCEKNNESEILVEAWSFGPSHSPLFDGITAQRKYSPCATQLKVGFGYSKVDPEISHMIESDPTIPSYSNNLALSQLPTFAKIQRLVDKQTGREVPV